jgi:hypothetical protein
MNTPHGFAETPPILQDAGPQMEDYPDWDSWYFARQMWVMERMTGSVDPRMKAAAERMRIRRDSTGEEGS